MIDIIPDASRCLVELPRRDLVAMARLVKSIYRLHRMAGYLPLIREQLPETARFDPGHDAVMMGYDFHLAADGPRLIEVNTNAGGLMLAWQAHQEPDNLEKQSRSRPVSNLIAGFYREMELFSNGSKKKPKRIAIVDAEPQKQFLYPEMQQFAMLFKSRGIDAYVVDPTELQAGENGVFLAGKPVDFIYNRHCDFYLESDAMTGIRTAYLTKKVCLSPNPRAYGLLADKRRLLIWNDPDVLDGLGVSETDKKLLSECVPDCRLLSGFDPEDFWSQRRQWVVKPVDSFGSRGVIMGKSISRARLVSMPPATTLVQRLVPPSTTQCPWGGKAMKTDLRLFVYGNKVLGVTARIYSGQVTSFREPGSGYAPVQVV